MNFFASLVRALPDEHPMLDAARAATACRSYGIDYKDKPEERGLAAAQAIPIARSASIATAGPAIDFGVYGVPETYVIDKAGRSATASWAR